MQGIVDERRALTNELSEVDFGLIEREFDISFRGKLVDVAENLNHPAIGKAQEMAIKLAGAYAMKCVIEVGTQWDN